MKKTFGWAAGILLGIGVIATSFKPAPIAKADTLATATTVATDANSLSARFGQFASNVYQGAALEQSGLSLAVFEKALTGFYNLKLAHKLPQKSQVLTVVDFTLPSRAKRMWIIDLANKALLLNTWVAHGQGSGDDVATKFSNTEESHQSSLGFYVTDDIYFGKHGRSLRLDGMDAGFNNLARQRAIVIHAADYVCQNTINQLGRLGRSFGCPAVSPLVANQVINTLKGRNMLFINGNDNRYNSRYLNTELAASAALGTDTAGKQPLTAAL
ncbi:murein L,D-transpeptidase catalytic domain family protein [Mucilaginibacter sp. RS28]|uniref:Murein L,D-transpeptidase catalytic domain family protein n=1 Tax=Mucilaginibacter straminoryzae TaxID=2932774 RepID=A0A9X2B7X9_9SPHI|nr:murein L,D-transpeptidase catalytic domain family protein [Mucilaginibacter straminoryzae]MCJ8209069.1 murein L,D-transpeptidase catalytic domain family protein [Mucilaginibacter straminoryzae]